MTKEMWDFAPEDGQLYFEKAVEGFLPQLFEKWQQTGANHSVTLIFFSRTFYSSQILADSGSEAMSPEERGQLMTDWAGRLYHDFYSVIAQYERISDLPELKRRLKQKFLEYPRLVNWNKAADVRLQEAVPTNAIGENSSADTCNFLEAISLGQNMFDRRRYIDCDLSKSGQTIVLVSAGTGIYHVDAALAQDVKQRMVDNGTGCDLVCLTKQPLHVVPLFVLHYLPSRFLPRPIAASSADAAASGGLTPAQSGQMQRKTPANQPSLSTSARNTAPGVGSFSTSFGTSNGPVELPPMPELQQLYAHLPQGPVFKIGHWMFLFFWESGRKDYGGDDPVDRLSATQTFVPSCRVPGLQFKPLLSNTEILIPFRVSKRAAESARSRISSGQATSPPSSPPSLDQQLPFLTSQPKGAQQQFMDEYDARLFGLPVQIPTDGNSRLSVSGSANQLARTKSFQNDSSNNLAAMATPTAAGLTKNRSITALAAIADAASATPKRSSLRTSGVIPRDSETPVQSARGSNASANPGSLAMNVSSRSGRRQPGSQASSPESQSGQQLLSARSVSAALAKGNSPNKKLSASSSGVHAPHSINPFNHAPESAPLPSSNRARWSHIFPRANMLQELYDSDSFGPHWKSLSQPGALPLTTGYMPSQTTLNKDFEEYPHTLAVIPEDCVYGESVDDLFRELVSQRLLFGYQLVEIVSAPAPERPAPSGPVPSVSVSSPSSGAAPPTSAVTTAASISSIVSSAATSSASGGGVTSLDERKKLRYVLSTGYSFHKLGFDGLTQNVEVKRYHRKKALAPQTRPLQYKYFLYAHRAETRLSRQAQLGYQAMVHYKWNHIDQLIAGYVYDFFDSLIFWRLSLMLVPAQATPASVSAAASGFDKFKEFLVQRIAKNVMDDEFSKIQISVVQPAPVVVASEPAAAVLSPQQPLESSNIRGILSGLQSSAFGERKSKNSGRVFPSGCFGADALEWIMRSVRGCNGTASATNLMTILIKSGYLTDSDSSGPAPFDASHLYILSELAPAFLSGGKSGSNPANAAVTPQPAASSSQPHRVRQRTVRLEMERSRTDRVEWANLKYDSVFNPEIVYEMELQWIVGTGGVIQEFVNALARRAKLSGLTLQLIPTVLDQRIATPHPFFAPMSRPFHFARLSDHGRKELVDTLTAKLDFVPRKTSGQFIHRSGALLLDVRTDGFDWTINWADAAIASAASTIELVKRLSESLATLDIAPLDDDGKIQSQVFDSLVTQPQPQPSANPLLLSVEVPLGKSTANLVRDGSLPSLAPAGSEIEGTPVLGRAHVKPPVPVQSESAPSSPQGNHHAHPLHHPHVVSDPSAEPKQEKPKKKVTFARNTNPQVYWYAMNGSTGRPSRAPEEPEESN
jgi:hypothetical protein